MIGKNTVFGALFGLLLMAHSAQADERAQNAASSVKYVEASISQALDPADIVIKEQLEAIRERNDRLAFELNAQSIKDDFEDPQSFMRMIRRNKGALYDHVSYEILSSSGDASKFHKVRLMDKYGHRAMAMFKMKQNAQGEWKTEDIIILTTQNDPL